MQYLKDLLLLISIIGITSIVEAQTNTSILTCNEGVAPSRYSCELECKRVTDKYDFADCNYKARNRCYEKCHNKPNVRFIGCIKMCDVQKWCDKTSIDLAYHYLAEINCREI